MTTRQMAQVRSRRARAGADGAVAVACGRYRSPGIYAVEPDATSAGYFAALPLVVGGSLGLEGLRPAEESLQGDIRFLGVLARCGATVSSGSGGVLVAFAPGGRASA
jgi:3-phosphoshikimate 1-carboxyvinyltransferase